MLRPPAQLLAPIALSLELMYFSRASCCLFELLQFCRLDELLELLLEQFELQTMLLLSCRAAAAAAAVPVNCKDMLMRYPTENFILDPQLSTSLCHGFWQDRPCRPGDCWHSGCVPDTYRLALLSTAEQLRYAYKSESTVSVA